MPTPAISALLSTPSIPKLPGVAASTPSLSQGFPGLIQTLLRGGGASQPDLKKPDTNSATATDPANPFGISVAVPQPAALILPLRFTTLSTTAAGGSSNGSAKTKKDDASPSHLRGDDTSQPGLQKTDTGAAVATDPANPFGISVAVPQPAALILPLRLTTLSTTAAEGPSNGSAKTRKDDASPSSKPPDDALGPTIFPSSLPQPFLPVTPQMDLPAVAASGMNASPRNPLPLIAGTGVTAAQDGPPKLSAGLSAGPSAALSTKDETLRMEPAEPFSLVPTIQDEGRSAPRVATELTPTGSAALPQLAFQAKLTPAKPDPLPGRAALTPASVSTPATASAAPSPTVNPSSARQQAGQQSGQQQDPPSSVNSAPAVKPQPKAPVDRYQERPEDGSSAVAPGPKIDSGGITSASAAPADRPGYSTHRSPEGPHAGAPTAAQMEAAQGPAHATTPLRDLSLRLTSATNEQVNVTVQDKGGELRVAVHSNSPELSADLRQQVGDLVGKLDRTGFHTELEKSGSSSLSGPAAGQKGDGQGQEFSGQQRQQEQGRQQEKEPGTARAVRDRQPQWLQAMNGTTEENETDGAQNR